ncbi:MAG TPA: hypothetical protein VGI68_11330 [Mycobacterium sp.]
MSQRQIIATAGGKRDYVINALALLQRDGHVSDKTPYKLLRPYAEELKSA